MIRQLHRILSAGLAIAGLLLATAAAPAAPVASGPTAVPVTFTVNSANDAVADFTSDPLFNHCRTNVNNSTCTLRAALMNANRHAGGAIIILPAGLYQLHILPAAPFGDANGSLDISNTVSLIGAGAAGTIVDGGGLDSVFVITPTVSVTMTGLTIQHGHSGGGGAIQNAGQLSLADSVLTGNFGHEGGAFLNSGTATISRSALVDNVSDKFGGAINNVGVLTLNASTVARNTAADGGAVENGGTLTVFDSTFSNNSAAGFGGGLDNYATASFYQSTIAGNLADNTAIHAGAGGGLFNGTTAAHVQLYGTLLADNYLSHTANECGGPLTLQVYDLLQNSTGCTVTDLGGNSLVNTLEPGLDALANNGGPTPTRALPAGSLAIDQVPPAQCQDQFGTAPVPDQRGVARPIGPKCDIGAFEGAVPQPLYGRNLIVNGDAEASAGSPTGGWVGAPGWGVLGQFTVVPYNAPNGFPAVPTDTVPANHGANFFAGGNAVSSQGSQSIILADSGRINTGRVGYILSADLGGFSTQADNASVVMQFQSGPFPIGNPVSIGPVTAADRGNQTGFRHVTATGFVPAGASIVFVHVILISTLGYNDGYADNVSLVLLPPPVFLPVVTR